MSRKELKFTEIISMISRNEVPEGTVFQTPAIKGASHMLSAVYRGVKGLRWCNTDGLIPLSSTVINDKWFVEEKETELSFTEAMELIKEDKWVKAVDRVGNEHTISLWTDFDELDFCDFDDLFQCTFYKKDIC